MRRGREGCKVKKKKKKDRRTFVNCRRQGETNSVVGAERRLQKTIQSVIIIVILGHAPRNNAVLFQCEDLSSCLLAGNVSDRPSCRCIE